MTPMIDVVFQLLIFFLLSGHLVQQESHLKLDLPKANTAQEDESDPEAPRLTINVTGEGKLLHQGREVTPEELRAQLLERQAQYGKGVEVRIRCDRHVPYKNVEPVMLACVQAGLWNVTYAAVKTSEEPR
jgi:biopolymer transport protein ExbD